MMTYQGYANYETWIVKVWIDNEQSKQDYWHGLARECLQDAVPSEFLSARQEAEVRLEHLLKDAHWEAYDRAESPVRTGVMSDLLKSALDEVHWKSLAETIMEEATS